MASSQRHLINTFIDEHVYILCSLLCVYVGQRAANELQGEVVKPPV